MTPISNCLGISFKLESSNLTGSAKDRAIPAQLDRLISLNYSTAVISSSGNAAISAAYHCRLKNIPLTIFLSSKITSSKLKILENLGYPLKLTLKPNSEAFNFAQKNHAYNLRQSTDPAARAGYGQIGVEINAQFPQATSIFIPVGSGTTLLGIADTISPSIKIIAVQPASWAPIASRFDPDFTPENSTVTDALSVKMLPKKTEIISLLTQRLGWGIVPQNSDVVLAQNWLKNNSITASAETALCLSGLRKLQSIKPSLVGPYPLILVTGNLRS